MAVEQDEVLTREQRLMAALTQMGELAKRAVFLFTQKESEPCKEDAAGTSTFAN